MSKLWFVFVVLSRSCFPASFQVMIDATPRVVYLGPSMRRKKNSEEGKKSTKARMAGRLSGEKEAQDGGPFMEWVLTLAHCISCTYVSKSQFKLYNKLSLFLNHH